MKRQAVTHGPKKQDRSGRQRTLCAVRAVVQRVSRASVSVDGNLVGSIGPGLLVLAGVAPGDTAADAAAVAGKVAGLRVFPDGTGAMNLDVTEVGGAVLVVSQFTLLADVRRGRRPSFSGAAPPDHAEPLVDRFVTDLRAAGLDVETGVFGASMQVELVNDGPVTLVVETDGGRVV